MVWDLKTDLEDPFYKLEVRGIKSGFVDGDPENYALTVFTNTVIIFYFELEITQSLWSWKEDSKTFNLIDHEPPNSLCLRVTVI